MWINGPSEDFSIPKTETPENKNLEANQLREDVKAYIDQVTEQLQNNPALQDALHADFENMLQTNLETNPESILRSVDSAMHTEIASFFDKLQSGELPLEEAKKEARQSVIKYTTTKLYLLRKMQS